ncbi:MAG: 50S ribosomal protein L5 [Mycoplasma sp.]
MGLKAKKYIEQINAALMQEYQLKNVMQVPRLEKICINAGIGDAASDSKLIDVAAKEIQAITGQKPVLTRAKKAIATFKVREGQPIGVKVTLRGEKMWNFIENLVNVALPRVRDFKGLPYDSFDNQGNYTMGIKEQIIFTEINFDEVKRVRGFNVTFVMSTNNKDMARSLLKVIGLPIVTK